MRISTQNNEEPKESRTKWMFLFAFCIAIGISWFTTLGAVWILILATVIFCLLAISPLNRLIKTSNSYAGETKDDYVNLLIFVIGISIAYLFLSRVF